MIHIATITAEITIHPECKAQITSLKVKKAPVSVSAKYLDFANVFCEKFIVVLPEYTEINTHAINLEEGKQSFYGFIYSLGLVELKILKTYIDINLAKGFICLSKSFAGALILFDQNLMKIFNFISTIEVLITLPLRIGIRFYLLVNPLIK